MKKLSARQVGIILFISIVSLKFIIMPSLVYQISKNNSHISILINLVSDFGSIFTYFWFMKKYPNLSFKTALEKCFGKTIPKILFLLLAFYFFFKAFITLKEIQNYFNRVLFDDFDWIKYIIPSTILLAYLASKPFQTFGRCGELLIYIAIFCIVIILISTNSSANYSELLPILKDGVPPVLKGAFQSTFGFGDYIFMLLFLGKIKQNKNNTKTILTYCILAIIFIYLLYLIFISTFGNLSVNENLAISDISLNLSIPPTVGRLEWLNILFWSFILFFNTGLLLASCKECLLVTLSTQKQKYVLLGMFAIYVGFLLYEDISLSLVLQIISSTPFVIFASIIQIGYPALLFLTGLILKKKKIISNKKFKISNQTTLKSRKYGSKI